MNVLIINASSDLYGANRILLQTTAILKPRKIMLIVPSEGLLTEFLKGNPAYDHVQVKIIKEMPVVFRKMNLNHGFRLLKNIYSFKRIIKKIKKEFSIDWVYVNTLSSFIIIGILKKLRLKILVHVHEILENDRLSTKTINKYSIKWADKMIAVSEPVKLNFEKVYNRHNIVTVLNGISDMYLPMNSEKLQLTVTLFGRIKPEKGIWFFLDAIALLDAVVLAKANFNIIGGVAPGGDHFIAKLKNDIANHPAKKNIQFISFIPDVRQELNNSDIVVVPSLMKDPFPTTILEAASAGKPVIATNTGGSMQSVKDNCTGFLIDAFDTKKFADCLRLLIESKELREEMGKAARKFYLENFTLEIFNHNFCNAVNDFEKEFVF